MGKKRAFFVVGPPSSGNRLVVSILVRAGCEGQAYTAGKFVQGLPMEGEDPVAILRSVPHGFDIPPLGELHEELVAKGYDVMYVVTVRDPYCSLSSIPKRHPYLAKNAEENYYRAYLYIMEHLGRVGAKWTLAVYEALVRRTESVRQLLKRLGLPDTNLDGPLLLNKEWQPKIVDGDAKWYEEAPPI